MIDSTSGCARSSAKRKQEEPEEEEQEDDEEQGEFGRLIATHIAL